MKLAIFIFSCVASTFLHAANPVWQISKDDKSLFLAGAVHVLRTIDLPLPKAFNQAYQKSQVLVFEADIGKLDKPNIVTKYFDKFFYSNHMSLKDKISENTYYKLKNNLAVYGINLDDLNKLKPGMLAATVTVQILQQLGVSEKGVDFIFWQRAVEDNKKTLHLESLEQHLSVIANMGLDNTEQFMLIFLKELRKNNLKEYQELVNAWRNADMKKLNDLIIVPTKEQGLYESLVLKRNKDWLKQIVAMLETHETEMVIVGMGHLIGKDGLLEMLQARGFNIKQL